MIGWNREPPEMDAAQGVVVKNGVAAGLTQGGGEDATIAVDGEMHDNVAVQMTLQLVPRPRSIGGCGQRNQLDWPFDDGGLRIAPFGVSWRGERAAMPDPTTD